MPTNEVKKENNQTNHIERNQVEINQKTSINMFQMLNQKHQKNPQNPKNQNHDLNNRISKRGGKRKERNKSLIDSSVFSDFPPKYILVSG